MTIVDLSLWMVFWSEQRLDLMNNEPTYILMLLVKWDVINTEFLNSISLSSSIIAITEDDPVFFDVER